MSKYHYATVTSSSDEKEDPFKPTYFNTITQYDHSYDKLWLTNTDAKKGLACPYFSIYAAQEFLNTGDCDKESHEKSLEAAIRTNVLLSTSDEMTFDTLISFTDLNSKDIGCTTVELLATKEFDLGDTFKSEADRFAVIFLKNAKFFAVLVDDTGFHVRDAHESVQFNYVLYDDLMEHLEKTYQFKSKIDLGDISYDNYGSIEFIKIERKFTNVLNNLIESKMEDQEEAKKIEKVEKTDEKEFKMIQAAIAASLKEDSAFAEFDPTKLCDSDGDSLLISDSDDEVEDNIVKSKSKTTTSK